jgi:hypothetical protein
MLPIATKERPLRCSRLHILVKCSMQTFLTIDDEQDVAGPAAHTGSVVHAGVAAFHKHFDEKLDLRKENAWSAIAAAMQEFPQADETEVRLYITPYMKDPRNIHAIIPKWIDGEPAIEKKLDFTLPPHELDPTEAQIHIQGTFDQIRMINGVPYLHDVKTGKQTIWEMIHDHALQVCAYTFGIHQVSKQTNKINKYENFSFDSIKPGKLIRMMGYRAKTVTLFNDSPDGVMIDLPYYKWKHVEWLLDNVRLHVALYRRGYINFGPGYWCTYCPKGGLTGCLDSFEQLELKK